MASEEETLALLIVLLRRRRRKVRLPRTWARDEISKSWQQGAYPNLLRELNAEDPEDFRQFHRLERESFETTLAMVAPLITKEDTHIRRSLLPGEKLSITFRFLATAK